MTDYYGTGSAVVDSSISALAVVRAYNNLLQMSPIGGTIVGNELIGAQILTDYLPQYMQDGYVMQNIMEGFSLELINSFRLAKFGISAPTLREDLEAQLHVNTATWGLKYWEEQYGLTQQVYIADPVVVASRRNAVFAAMRGRKEEGEMWFQSRLELLLGAPVIITPLDPETKQYEVDVEPTIQVYENPPFTAMTAAVSATGGVLSGTYTYRATFVFSTGETDSGASESNSVSPALKQVDLTAIPTSGAGALSRKIYRSKSPDPNYYFVGEVPNDFDTTFSDNTSDVVASANPVLTGFNTAANSLGSAFLALVRLSKPAHIHVTVRSNRFRASINAAGDPV